jgi:hypothetical protein
MELRKSVGNFSFDSLLRAAALKGFHTTHDHCEHSVSGVEVFGVSKWRRRLKEVR